MGKIIGIPFQSTWHAMKPVSEPLVYAMPLVDMGLSAKFLWEKSGLSECSGFLLPGSYTDVVSGGRGRVDLNLYRLCRRILSFAVQEQRPVLGICYGFQYICHFFGGQVANVRKFRCIQHWRSNWQEWWDREQHHEIESHLPQFKGAEVNSSHRQGVVQLPKKHMRTLDWAPDGFVEAAEHKKLPIVGFQWHPERELHKQFNRSIFEAFGEMVGK